LAEPAGGHTGLASARRCRCSSAAARPRCTPSPPRSCSAGALPQQARPARTSSRGWRCSTPGSPTSQGRFPLRRRACLTSQAHRILDQGG